MTKLIIDCRCIENSGIGIYISEMLLQLNRSDFDVEVILFHEQLNIFDDLKLTPRKVHIISFDRYSLRNLWSLNNILSDCDYYFSPSLSILPLAFSVKKIVTVHDLCPIKFPNLFGQRIKTVYSFLLFLQLIGAYKVIAISKFTKDEIANTFTPMFNKKIHVVYNGLSGRLLNFQKRMSQYSGEKPFLLCVGNIKPHKNIIPFIDYFINQSHFSQDYHLLVVGQKDGFMTNVDNALINSSSVTFTGKVTDEELASLYRTAALFIFPSLYEGFGLPLLEAMSFDLPIIASDIPVFREIADNNIEYFNPLDFSGFDEALSKIKRCNYPLSYDCILNKYSWENTYDSFNKMLLNENSTS